MFTVGHGTADEATLLALLHGAGVAAVVDVRAFPGRRSCCDSLLRVSEERWEADLASAWVRLDELDGDGFVALIDEVAARCPRGDGTADFERACARDSTGHPDTAVPRYRAALDAGLPGIRRRRAVIQMASSLRNLGEPEQALALLQEESREPSDELDDALAAFLALALADHGRERDGLRLALAALAPHLPRYQRSVGAYARLLTEPDGAVGGSV